jgi:hypothetical protein
MKSSSRGLVGQADDWSGEPRLIPSTNSTKLAFAAPAPDGTLRSQKTNGWMIYALSGFHLNTAQAQLRGKIQQKVKNSLTRLAPRVYYPDDGEEFRAPG